KTQPAYDALKTFEFHHMAASHANSTYHFWAYESFHHAYAAATLGFPELVRPLVENAMGPYGQLKQNAYDKLARTRMQTAMHAFSEGSTREELLRAMQETHLLYPESEC